MSEQPQPSKSPLHRDLQPLICEGGLFDVEPDAMDLNIGRHVRFLAPKYPADQGVHRIIGVQRNYRWQKCYRVVTPENSFGRVAHPDAIEFVY